MIEEIDSEIKALLNEQFNIEIKFFCVSWATNSQEHICDATSTIALGIWKQVQESKLSICGKWKSPLDVAIYLADEIKKKVEIMKNIESIEVASPGYLNINFNNLYWANNLRLWKNSQTDLIEKKINGKKIMIEYGHPNTHKEMHIGHLRTLITGESLARLANVLGGKIVRANYQGDIGPQVAKALYGVRQLLVEQNTTVEEIDAKKLIDKAKFLGEAYVRGNADYDNKKDEINKINIQLYSGDESIYPLYLQTRQWSLDYFKSIYDRLGTKYDKLYFETEVAAEGKKIVTENTGEIFKEDQGAVVFKGEEYGLHTRVFITSGGTPTYEAKEMALALRQFNDFPFDLNLHIVANEQAEYFKVVFKALEQLNSDIAKRERHISMGMFSLVGMKMSSRTGVIITVTALLDQIKNEVNDLLNDGDSRGNEVVAEALTLGALKFAILKQSTTINVAFDIKKSVALLGFTGPYLQYTYARCKSLLDKSDFSTETDLEIDNLAHEEKSLIFWLNQYSGAINKSWNDFSLHHLCEYLHELAQRYNLLYNNLPVLDSNTNEKNLRLTLTKETSKRLDWGLQILGIKALERL